MDVKNVVLNGKIDEEITMRIPPGSEDKREEI